VLAELDTNGNGPPIGTMPAGLKPPLSTFLRDRACQAGLTNASVLDQAPRKPGLLDNCTLLLPSAAVHQLQLEPNIEDKGRDKTMWFGRAWQLRALLQKRSRAKLKLIVDLGPSELAELAGSKRLRSSFVQQMAETENTTIRKWRGLVARHSSSLEFLQILDDEGIGLTGTVVLMHGSGGLTASNLRYARLLGGLGYLVVAPDSMAAGRFRTRSLEPPLGHASNTDYWATNLLYNSLPEGPLAYSTTADDVVQEPERWRRLYTNVHRLRTAELGWTLRRLPRFAKQTGVSLLGVSEGGVATAQFDTSRFGELVRSRVVSTWSVEQCYFSPLPHHRLFGGPTHLPCLNLIGTDDQFFGPEPASVASKVARAFNEPQPTGNAFTSMVEQGVERGLVVLLEGAHHDPTQSYDDLLRDLLRSFLAAPERCHRLPDHWARIGIHSGSLRVLERAGRGGGVVLAQAVVPSRAETHKEEEEKLVMGLLDDMDTDSEIDSSMDGERWPPGDVRPDDSFLPPAPVSRYEGPVN